MSDGLRRAVIADDRVTEDSGWLAAAKHVASPNHDDRPPGTVVDLIVVHAISLPPAQFGDGYIDRLFCNELDPRAHPYFRDIADLRVSAHFLIERDGELKQFVSTERRAWHCGQSSYRGRSACNDFSIGIELEGCDTAAFTDAQYERLGSLLPALFARYPACDATRLAGHSDIAPGRKTDPGPCFDWQRVHRDLSVSARGISGTATP